MIVIKFIYYDWLLLLLLLGENDTEKGDHFVISLHTIPVSGVLVFLRVNYTTHHIVFGHFIINYLITVSCLDLWPILKWPTLWVTQDH